MLNRIKIFLLNLIKGFCRVLFYFIFFLFFSFPFAMGVHVPTLIPVFLLQGWNLPFSLFMVLALTYLFVKRIYYPKNILFKGLICFYLFIVTICWFYVVQTVVRIYFLSVLISIGYGILIFRKYKEKRIENFIQGYFEVIGPLLCIYMVFVVIFFRMGQHKCDTLAKTPHLIKILDFCDSSWKEKLRSRFGGEMDLKSFEETRWMVRIKNHLYISSSDTHGRGPVPSFIFDANTGVPLKRILPDGGIRSSAYDEELNIFAAAVGMRMLVRLYKEGSVKPFKTYYFGKAKPHWVRIDPKTHYLFICFEKSKYHLRVYDLRTLEEVKKESFVDVKGLIFGTSINTSTHRLYMLASLGEKGFYLISYDTKHLKEVARKQLWYVPLDLAFDFKRGNVCVTYPYYGVFYGLLSCYNGETLEEVKRMKVPMWSRKIISDFKGNIFIGNYVTGKLNWIDIDKREIVRTVFLGKRIRCLEYDDEKNLLYVGNANGFMAVKLSEWK